MANEQPPYLAYLLRLWQAGQTKNGPVWRVAIESPHTGERRVFANLPELCAFLAEKIEQLTTEPDVKL